MGGVVLTCKPPAKATAAASVPLRRCRCQRGAGGGAGGLRPGAHSRCCAFATSTGSPPSGPPPPARSLSSTAPAHHSSHSVRKLNAFSANTYTNHGIDAFSNRRQNTNHGIDEKETLQGGLRCLSLLPTAPNTLMPSLTEGKTATMVLMPSLIKGKTTKPRSADALFSSLTGSILHSTVCRS